MAVLHYMTTTKRDREYRLWYGVAAMQGERVEQRLDGLTMDSGSIRRLVQRLNYGGFFRASSITHRRVRLVSREENI